MKMTPYDYSGFRLSRLTEPRFSHLLLLLGWVGYFLLYYLTENFIPPERCHVIHCALDDLIPFNEYFLLAYCFWYALVFGSLLFFLIFDVDSFRALQTYIIITQAVAMAVYILWPSRQDLRPETFARDNILTRLMAFIYSFDTSTGVCPSLHVGYSLGIASVWCKKKDAPRGLKAFVVAAVALICASVCFVKQHSAVDVAAALPLCLLAELLVYWRSWWKPRLTGSRAQ
ncbi:MAG: hypothetical protein IKD79_04275 [Oscillospiraceae bacterium]|nr:hypothetical protein [Oscillospiraceae bacterium]